MQIDLYAQNGDKKGKLTLPAEIFEQKVNKSLLYEFVRMQEANIRVPIASVKTRSERSGPTTKPWRQKGTGRARQGSKKSAQWKKGGRIHGPSADRNFSKVMSRKMRQNALVSALSMRAGDDSLFALEKYEVSTPKTKDFAKLLQKLPMQRSLLLVLPENDVPARKSMRNIANLKTVLLAYLNPRDILQFEKICFLKEAFDKLSERFAK